MTALPSARTAGVAIVGAALAISALLGFGPGASDPQFSTPDCSSCDARHARLTELRAAKTEATE
ncbi:MAG: hypothetical protein EAZ40_16960 [Rhodobacterales bacterium]|nr:MAG: hypothetical protein EAZ40_16960 [Rhodobacterales bacterium]